MRAFVLQRDVDETGVSGVGVVAEGIEFSDGTVALRWLTEWPTSVVFHERGIDAVEAVHGHGGKTRIVFIDDDSGSGRSGYQVGGVDLTWREAIRTEQQRSERAERWATLVADLDRCEHGRHEGDVCSSCGGPSRGNLIIPPGAEIGHDLSGRCIAVPHRDDRYDVDAWVRPR